MKQQLLKALFVCMAVVFLPQVAHAAGDVEINVTNFPDENFRSYLLQQDYGKDGVLTEEEIKSIDSLYIVYRDIHSLQGIEYFTALTCLDCSHNQLTSLDVSKDTALTSLECYYNQLTALDVSKNTALTKLHCIHNKLTTLDVSKNTALAELECYDNQLTALDVSRCTALGALHCYNNQLTTLDVSKNTRLRELQCYVNKIKGVYMDNLINSLPICGESPWGKLRAYSSFSSDEGNVCTKEQVKAAKEKGWTVYYQRDKYDWQEYEGSDDTSSNIDNIRTEIDKGAPVYNLRGERLTAPQKGVNIIGRRKVVVK